MCSPIPSIFHRVSQIHTGSSPMRLVEFVFVFYTSENKSTSKSTQEGRQWGLGWNPRFLAMFLNKLLYFLDTKN